MKATRFVGFAAAIVLATVVTPCGDRDAAVAEESDKAAAATPPRQANEPAAIATLRVRKIDTDDEYDRYRKTQLQLIKSPVVLASALRRPGIANLEALRAEKDQLGWLRDHLQVTAPPDAGVVQIRAHGADPSDLQQIVDAVALAYLTDMVIQPKVNALNMRDMKQRKLDALMAELESVKQEAASPANANPDLEARRKKREHLQRVTTQMSIELVTLTIECNMPCRVELIEETRDGAAGTKSTQLDEAAVRSDAADSR